MIARRRANDRTDDPDAWAAADFADRCAAVIVAQDMSRFAKQNAYNLHHFAYYVENFVTLLDKARENTAKQLAALRVDTFSCCDLNLHIDAAIAAHAAGKPGGLAMFPPFYVGGYETLYKFLSANVQWPEPDYPMFDPKTLPSILDRIEDAGMPYCVVTDHLLEGRKPALEYLAGRRRPHYGYVWSRKSSVRHIFNKAAPFKYTPMDVTKLTAGSRVKIVPASADRMNFLKDVFLAKHIVHSAGSWNYLVFVDDMLVGGLIYTQTQHGERGWLYLLSDVCACPDMHMSKLLSTIATSRALIRPIEAKLLMRVNNLATTAFTHRPNSMKYRGVWELHSRRPSENPDEGNVIQYHSPVREETPQAMYDAWFARETAPKTPQKGRRRGKPQPDPDPED